MITDEMVEAAARSDAEFDKRGWLEMPKHERERYLARARKSLTAANATAWRPIESAPRDGTWFVIFIPTDDRGWFEVGRHDPYMTTDYVETEPGSGLYRAEKRPSYDWRGFNNFHRATHWMPLPEPPPQQEGE